MNRSAIRRAIVGLALLAGVTGAARAQRILLVHLPSAPVEAANQQANAVTSLAEVLSSQLTDQNPVGHGPETSRIEPKIFRRWRDARAFLDTNAQDVAMLLSDAAFLHDATAGLRPAYRFVHQGRDTYRRLVVVRSDSQGLEKLVDLRDRSLAFVEAAGAAEADFLEAAVFDSELDPVTWFRSLEPAADDFEATASVLYGQTDAALVADYNSLLALHLGKELRTLFTSPQLSLPILSLREAAFEDDELSTLEQALANLDDNALGRQVLAGLGIERLEKVSDSQLTRPVAKRQKAFEIAAPEAGAVTFEAPPLPAPGELSYGLVVELPDVPLELDEDEPR